MSGPKHVSFYLLRYIDRMERQLEGVEVFEQVQDPAPSTKTPEEHRAELLERFGIKR